MVFESVSHKRQALAVYAEFLEKMVYNSYYRKKLLKRCIF
jgi:hypothetical protein